MGTIKSKTYNIYCDESCHLENDQIKPMVLGAIWCEQAKKDEIFLRIREIKTEFGIAPYSEIKWNKVSPSQKNFYLRLIDYFFDDDDIHFRALIVPDKSTLCHNNFAQTHDDFYYKMYFNLLKVIFEPNCCYNIYIDIKDTRSQSKVLKLTDILRSSHYDFDKKIIQRIQQIRSHETQLLPLADLLIGAIGYNARGLSGNSAKLAIIERIKQRSGYTLANSTLYKEDKLNLFFWKAQ